MGPDLHVDGKPIRAEVWYYGLDIRNLIAQKYFILHSTGTIKSCVLIENILATFEMESILYELRHHCIGLNCGIWDYSASIISLFGKSLLFGKTVLRKNE